MDNKTLRVVISICINFAVVLAAVIVMYSLGEWGFNLGSAVFNEQAVDQVGTSRTVEVTITANMTDTKLADLLYDKGLIEDKLVFRVQEMLSEYKGKFVAGTYTLDTSMKPTEILQAISGDGEAADTAAASDD
jgi:UPF0755 protein